METDLSRIMQVTKRNIQQETTGHSKSPDKIEEISIE